MSTTDVSATTHRYLNGLTTNWVACCLSLIIPIGISPFLSKQWLPIIVVVEVFFLLSYIRSNRFRVRPRCMRPVFLVMSVLLVSAMVMMAINLFHLGWFFGDEMTQYYINRYGVNVQLPFITVLIISPIQMVASAWAWIVGRKSSFCLECRAQYSFASDDGFVGHLLRSESSYQIRTLFYIGAFLSLTTWCYFLLFFINVNLNTPDFYIFVVMPVAVFALSIVYIIRRYMGFWSDFNARYALEGKPRNGVMLRYMVISEGEMWLGTDPKTGLWDTPARLFLANTYKVSETEAGRRFEFLTGIHDYNLRYAYRSSGCDDPIDVYHYLIFARKRSEVDHSQLEGEWFNAFHIASMIRNKEVNPQFAGAFRRVYTIAMAWKTYDVNGKRLYPIKNYRPTFRLKDMEDWDVNYDDARWLNISCNNEDKLMFRVRDLWRRYVRCIGC